MQIKSLKTNILSQHICEYSSQKFLKLQVRMYYTLKTQYLSISIYLPITQN